MRHSPFVDFLADIGRGVVGAGRDFVGGIGFLGEVVGAFLRVITRPTRFRGTPLVHQLEHIAFRGVPIIVLISFLVGCIVAQQGIFQLRKFGATAFVVNLTGILTLRELGVLLTSIMVAGRSGSAFTAEIGSMKMREEIDALRVMGLDPVEVLIVPRILALIIALPILTFLSDMAALYGGGLVAWIYGDISPDVFAVAPARLDRPADLHGRADQGAVHGPRHRPHRLDGRARGGGLGRIARPARHVVGREVDLHGHRARRASSPCSSRRSGSSHAGHAAPRSSTDSNREVVIRVRDLEVGFGERLILNELDLDVYRGEILGFVGGSGQGKSVLTRTILGLVPKRAGTIEVFGEDLDELSPQSRRQIERRWGVLFQHGALFSSLTVKQNVQVPMREYLTLSDRLLDELAMLKIEMVGLKPDAADKLPSELSGGMIKRAALARALSLDPEILFLDEPTSGLDPIGAGDFDELIATLQQTLGLTVFMVTHDLDSLYTVCDRIAALGDGHVIAGRTDRDHAGLGPSVAEVLFPRQAGARGAGRRSLRYDRWKHVPITP